jgi:hypothetical protein
MDLSWRRGGPVRIRRGGGVVRRIAIAGLACLGGLTSGGKVMAQTPADAWTTTFNSDVRYFNFRSSSGTPVASTSSGGSGSQVYAPLALQLTGRPNDDVKLDFMLRAASVFSRQTSAGATNSFSGFTDTTFTSSFTYLGWNGVQPFVALALNLPTGTSNASGNQQLAKSDADIVRLPAFGEGLNVGPSIGVNVPITQALMASLGVGYTNRGPFNREADTAGATNRLDPGDVTSFTASLGYRDGPLALKGSFAYSLESTTTIDGGPFYQSGDRIILTTAAGYTWSENWSSRAQATFSHFNRNKVRLPGATDIATEAFNSNSNVVNVNFDTTYAAGAYSIGPTLGFVYRDRNSWNPETFQFLPAKTSWSVGLAGSYAVTPAFKLSASVARIWVKEGDSPDKIADGILVPNSAIPAIVTDAWTASIAGSVRF